MAIGRPSASTSTLPCKGSSFEEVFGSLQEAISLYLETVADLPADQQSCAPSPAGTALDPTEVPGARGAWPVLRQNGDRQRHQFTMPLAA